MIQKCNIWSVLRVFLDDPLPAEGMPLRWISRKARLAHTSVKIHLNSLEKEGLVKKENGRSFPVYRAVQESEKFRFYKKMDILFRLVEETGLVEALWDKLSPTAIVLFGSASRGEDVGGSDIDIFIGGREKRFDANKFEKPLARKISLHFGDFKRLPKELSNNIANGVVLAGYLEAF